jgi:cytochrome P450
MSQASTGEAASLTVNPFDFDVLQDPFPMYRRLRDEAPVQWNDAVGTYWVSRYDDVHAGVFNDRDFSAKTTAYQLGVTSGVDLGSFGRTNTLPTSDPPDHARLRQIANKAFVPRAIAQYRPHIATIVDEYFDQALGAGEVEIVSGLAESLPILVIAAVMGIPAAEAARFKRASLGMMKAFTGPNMTPDEGQQATEAVRYLEELFDAARIDRQRAPKADLLTRLAEAEAEEQRLSRREYLATCLLLLLAGNETTTNSISAMFYLLATHKDQLAAVRADPGLADQMVEEVLRILGPVHWSVRRARTDVEIAGTTVPAGSGVSFLLASANCDERHYPEPDKFLVGRNPADHLAFGRGRHLCLGAPLARAEMQAVANAIVQRCADIELRTPELVWGGSLQSRGIQSLKIALRAA